ncbi:MAG: HAMP domain-containing protein, partial [Azoarcus sp.]|nr:HAMP domain-containing protein [Azoarcus sp.]
PRAEPNSTLERTSYGIVSNSSGATHYRYTTPIRVSGLSWGSIEIDFATTEYDANTREMYKQLLFISILVVLAILPVGYFFALWLIRPIADISQAASRVAQGDLDAHVDIARQDEIGQLSRSFNQMVDALQQSRTQVRFYNQALEQKVAERTHELDELNRTLDQRVRDEISKRKEQETLLIHQSRLAAMGEMIGAIAHQWRQPLNALSLVMQNIRMQHRSGRLTEQSMARMQEKSEQLVQRMSSTIDDFRDFFKPDKHAVTFNLARVIQSSANIMDGVFNNHCIALTIDCDEEIEVFGIPGEFSQVILNLLSNAKDAVQDAHQASPRIHVHASRDGNRVRICVDDNGGGIAPGIMDRIYEPYFTTKTEGKGSGIGLYMSRMIVENNMHGQLAASNTGEGARFTIELEASDKLPEADVAPTT